MRDRKNKQTVKNKNLTLDRYFITHEWSKGTTRRTLDQDKVIWCLENNLPVEELYDDITYFEKYENEDL